MALTKLALSGALNKLLFPPRALFPEVERATIVVTGCSLCPCVDPFTNVIELPCTVSPSFFDANVDLSTFADMPGRSRKPTKNNLGGLVALNSPARMAMEARQAKPTMLETLAAEMMKHSKGSLAGFCHGVQRL